MNEAHILPAEDSVVLERLHTSPSSSKKAKIVVPVLSRISNFDDLDPLRHESNLDLIFARPTDEWPDDTTLVILTGSKSTISDLAEFRACGGAERLSAHIKRGGHVLGICGGYQMLGNQISDPHCIEGGIEGNEHEVAGLGHLDITTKLGIEKRVCRTQALSSQFSTSLETYEIHMGETIGEATKSPMFELPHHDGAISPDSRIQGCYLHGLFANDDWRRHYLGSLGITSDNHSFEGILDRALDDIASQLDAIFGTSLFDI